MEKFQIRKEALLIRKNLNQEESSSKVIKILEQFLHEEEIYSYEAMKNEINLKNLNIKQFLPLWEKENPIMYFEKENNIKVALIPGVAFDKAGNRIGYGKGYYDRWLKNFKGIKIGVTYSQCLFTTIECEEHDIKMDYVVTEKGIYGTENNNYR